MEQLEIIAMDTVDITGIGFYSLGSNRKELDDNQKKEYYKLFEGYFLKSFSSRLSRILLIQKLKLMKKSINENYTIVHSILVRNI